MCIDALIENVAYKLSPCLLLMPTARRLQVPYRADTTKMKPR